MTQPNPPAVGTTQRPRGATRLITDQSTVHVDNGVQDTDVRLGVQRGLAEYIERLSYDALGGRKVRFAAVHEEWAEPEEGAAYPSAVVLLRGPGIYAPRSFTPVLNPQQRLPPPDGRYLVIPAEFTQDLTVEIWATDPMERTALVQMCETAFNPVYWRYGFVLELPHYFNVRATYTLKDVTIPDSEDDALRRYRRAIFTLTAEAPLVTLFSFPDARPLFELRAVGPDVIVETDVQAGVVADVQTS